MFTGLIKELGTLIIRAGRGKGAILTIGCPELLPQINIGDSVAVDGVCLTAGKLVERGFEADLSAETLNRSTLGKMGVGSRLNLELPLSLNDRLGGHIVQGHVDGLGKLAEKNKSGEGWELAFSFPKMLSRYLAKKGSIAINGISLTIADFNDSRLLVAVIPHTYKVTNLQYLNPGMEVNIEVDILAKYVERLLQPEGGKQGVTIDLLRDHGFVD